LKAFTDYGFYINEYRGRLSLGEFERYSLEATGLLNRLTFGRLKSTRASIGVKYACCSIAEELAAQEKHSGIKAERSGDLSVTYNEAQLRDYASIAKLYIDDDTLFFRGVV
jgi:hypothetical protein